MSGDEAMTENQCDQCPEPMEGPHHPECYRFVGGYQMPILDSDTEDLISLQKLEMAQKNVTIEDLISLFRDAASVNMTEDAVERQARRLADAVLSLYDVRRK
jgi:hypothetical protein